jgi:ABC-2 type transport system ATP-binding protein
MSEKAIIHAAGLTRRFGEFTAVDDITLSILPGTIFAFLGANGSGKSTTIRMLIGLLSPTSGVIEVDGVDVIQHPRRVRDRIGYMGQKVSLYQGLSLRENVEFYAGLYALSSQALAERWGALRERFALGEDESTQAAELPAGVRQRAGLALSTLHRPRILFLDEPTAGVDLAGRSLFWELIEEEADRGVTVFVTTHFLEEAEYCDRVCFIDGGRVVADATPAELRRRFSPGYRVRFDGPSHVLSRLRVALGSLEEDIEASGAAALVLRTDVLDQPLLERLQGVTAQEPEVRLTIDPPEMADVFRVLARGGMPA